MPWDEGVEPCSITPLAAAMDVAAREVSARMVSVMSVFTRGLGTPIFKGSANQLERLARIRSLADKAIVKKQIICFSNCNGRVNE